MYSNLYSIDYKNYNKIEEYISFIKKCKALKLPEYVENHHILPKSLFPRYEHNTENIIPLSPENHYTAHVLLAEIYGGKMLYALRMLSNRSGITCEHYSKLRKEWSIAHSKRMKILWEDPSYITKVNTNRNKVMHSKEYKKLLSDKQKERLKDPLIRKACGHRKGFLLPRYKCWVCDIIGRGKKFEGNHNSNCRVLKRKISSILKLSWLIYVLPDILEREELFLDTYVNSQHLKCLFNAFVDGNTYDN